MVLAPLPGRYSFPLAFRWFRSFLAAPPANFLAPSGGWSLTGGASDAFSALIA